MSLRNTLPGVAYDASPLARVQPAGLPPLAVVVAPAAIVQGVVYIPVPGPRGLAGSVAGTLPYTSITGAPVQTFVYPFSPASVIVVPHNMGRFPSVDVFDSSGAQWETDVTHNSTMQLTVSMSTSFSGRVICN